MNNAAKAHYKKPDWFTMHVFNPMVAGLTRLGVSVLGSRVLEVKGRASGEPRTNPVNLALYIDALTFAVSGLTILGLRQLSSTRPRTQEADGATNVGFLTSLREGLQFLGGLPWLRGLVLRAARLS